ncbi:MAG: hypothetical protein ACREVR_11095 [Burkholderiales bacterium]
MKTRRKLAADGRRYTPIYAEKLGAEAQSRKGKTQNPIMKTFASYSFPRSIVLLSLSSILSALIGVYRRLKSALDS